ncbi:MAG TPA: hypothetical protein PKB02_11740 [Anaerohalosphaeraceae bacterium]|nr:hypothetical protein [Anaerohalosphaeraceae bacterium]
MKHNRYKICIFVVLASLLCLMTGITQSLHIRVCHHPEDSTEHSVPCSGNHNRPDESGCRICQMLAGDQNSYRPDISPALVFGFDAGYRCISDQQSIVISFGPCPKASRAPPAL